MAYWTQEGGWQAETFPTNARTDYSAADFASAFTPAAASDFAANYPYKNAGDFSGTYPANRNTSTKFWVKVDGGKVIDFSWSKKTGNKWNDKQISNNGTLREQLGNLVDKLSDNQKERLTGELNTLRSNATENQNDLVRRQEAADAYNQTQSTNRNTAANQYNTNTAQALADETNQTNKNLNSKNQTINEWSKSTANKLSLAKEGSYASTLRNLDTSSLESLKNTGLLSQEEYDSFIDKAIESFDEDYIQNKLTTWDPVALGAQPLVGGFDADYYRLNTESGKTATDQWNAAQNAVSIAGRTLPDLDIVGRYSQDSYLHWHYTTQGRQAGERGNDVLPEAKEAWLSSTGAGGYQERLTDVERQSYRDQVLGISGPPGEERIIFSTPQYDETGALINEEEVDTLLEKKFSTVLSAADAQKEKQLGSLAQDVLKTSINELKKAKAKEANLSLMKNLPGYNEVLSVNSTLADSILGDTGVGGILAMLGDKADYKSDVQKSIEKITGVSSNSTLYNWQKWFEDTLLKRYENYQYDIAEYTDEQIKQYQDLAKQEIENYNKDESADKTKPLYLDIAERYGEVGNPLDVNNIEDFKKIMFNINLESQKEFVSSFINNYLKPRFDQSKSMDEFISYLDVKEEEQNIFQSQTVVNKLKQIADLKAKSFIDLIKQSEKAVQDFNASFYFDPISNNTKEISTEKRAQYELQKASVAQDFANAKEGNVGSDGINWAVEAYRYGLDGDFANDPEAFARLHYQVKGRFLQTDENGKPFNFDPAEDILPTEELKKQITDFGAELALRKQLYGDASFMQFVTPEEYADYLLESVDPSKNKEEWEKVLNQLGLDYTEDIQQVKDYLIESFRTEEAKQIRENIKYLNEAKEDLTQEKLGVTYIEREEDKKEPEKGQTALYNIFKNAGYGGTEDDFYSDFMPDVDRSDQELIAKSMSDKGLTFDATDMEDPFSALTNLSGLLGEDENVFEQEEDTEPKETSYFNIFGGDTEELPKKSKAAQSFLGEFTSMFSGFN